METIAAGLACQRAFIMKRDRARSYLPHFPSVRAMKTVTGNQLDISTMSPTGWTREKWPRFIWVSRNPLPGKRLRHWCFS